MPVTPTLSQILLLAPNARSSYREAFQNGQGILDQAKISATPLRLAHFMAQILHESGGLSVQFENLNYSALRLPKVWPSRFKPKGPLNPADYANNPQKLERGLRRSHGQQRAQRRLHLPRARAPATDRQGELSGSDHHPAPHRPQRAQSSLAEF